MKKQFKYIRFFLYLLIGSNIYGTPREGEQNLVLLPVKNDPTISFRIQFRVGSQNDPQGKEGLAAITASMLTDAATTKNSYEQILDKLFPLAASYNGSVSVEQTVISGRTHKDNLKAFYPLFIEAILNPAFKQEDLERIKSQTLNYLENTLRYSSDEELGKSVLYNEIFAGTPYGHITTGLVESVKRLTISDVKNFYKAYFTRENFVLGIGGGYEASLIKKFIKDLNILPSGKPVVPSKPVVGSLIGKKIIIIEKDTASTAISIGFPIRLLRGSKEWYALAIANSWFGEHRNSSSHLYQVIRETRGLNYGDYSYIENFPFGGILQMPPQNVCRRQQLFEIWIRPVTNETRHFVLRAALRELKMLMDNGLTEEEFKNTRNFLNKYVLHYAVTTMERLGYMLDDKFYGLTNSHLETFRKMMKEVTLKEVNDAIKKYLQDKNLQIAIITKEAAALKDSFVKEALSPISYPNPKSESVLAEDKEISAFPLEIKAENIKIIPVNELFR